MERYYISRVAMSIVLGAVFYFASGYLTAGVIGALVVMLVFLYLPRSGRYTLSANGSAAPFRRDEWARNISHRSGLNAWVVVTVAGSGMLLYYGLISPADMPVPLLGLLMLAGWITYFASDFWMRR